MKKIIDAFDYAGDICKAMKKGILLTTKADGQVNTMTIGWGTMGVEWGKPIFVAYVRGSRYTHQMIEKSGEFTVNIPIGEFDSKILGICGTKSGRDMDKIKELNLTLEEPLNARCCTGWSRPWTPFRRRLSTDIIPTVIFTTLITPRLSVPISQNNKTPRGLTTGCFFYSFLA